MICMRHQHCCFCCKCGVTLSVCSPSNRGPAVNFQVLMPDDLHLLCDLTTDSLLHRVITTQLMTNDLNYVCAAGSRLQVPPLIQQEANISLVYSAWPVRIICVACHKSTAKRQCCECRRSRSYKTSKLCWCRLYWVHTLSRGNAFDSCQMLALCAIPHSSCLCELLVLKVCNSCSCEIDHDDLLIVSCQCNIRTEKDGQDSCWSADQSLIKRNTKICFLQATRRTYSAAIDILCSRVRTQVRAISETGSSLA